jgi:PhoPQ-activated pathogenicity-related protein
MKKLANGILILLFAAVLLPSCSKKPVTPDTALQAYLDTKDTVFKWTINEKYKSEGITHYRIIFASQKWRGINWSHELNVMVPDKVEFNDALLFITGGSVKEGKPNIHDWSDELIAGLGNVAMANKAIVAIVRQIPNQPLYDDLTEDALISYTLHNYQNDKDLTWPLLFPMTKSAVKAMDVVQKFSKEELKREVGMFVISGASKRGWTTWLTGAHDSRVKAICPMVIDVLNMPVNIDYQKVVWGDYSIEIADYVNLGIAQQVNTPEGIDLVKMIDPYSYRKTLTMPKMIFMGTNDPYWPVDAIKNYIDSIPGDNHICYTPNAAHDLGGGEKAFATLSAFFGSTITGGKYPVCDYSVTEENGELVVKVKATPEQLVNAMVWSAVSKDQDFRDEKWADSVLNPADKTEILVRVKKPATGYKAFYVDLQYKAPFSGDYTQSTRMFVADSVNFLLRGK